MQELIQVYDFLWQESVEEFLRPLENTLPEDIHLFMGFPTQGQPTKPLCSSCQISSLPACCLGFSFHFLCPGLNISFFTSTIISFLKMLVSSLQMLYLLFFSYSNMRVTLNKKFESNDDLGHLCLVPNIKEMLLTFHN